MRSVKKLLALLGLAAATPHRERGVEESCGSCKHFIDYRDTEADPDECNGYCAFYVDTLGLEKALKIDEYAGGHWTHDKSWCSKWEGGDPVWGKPEDASGNTDP